MTPVEIENNQQSSIQEITNFIQEEAPQFFYEKVPYKWLTSDDVKNSTRLTNTFHSQEREYKLTKQGAFLTFDEPIFVGWIELTSPDTKKIKIRASLIGGGYLELPNGEQRDNNQVIFRVNKICTKVDLEIDGLFLRKTHISDMKIAVVSLDELLETERQATEVKDDRKTYSQQIATHKTKLESNLNDVAVAIQSYRDLLLEKDAYETELTESIATLENTSEELKERITVIKSEIDQETLKHSNLIKQAEITSGNIDNEKRKLSALKDANEKLDLEYKSLKQNVNLFPDTLVGFTNRTHEHKRLFSFLSAIPLILLILIIALAFDMTLGFSNNLTKLSLDQATAVLIQRAPFSLLIFALATLCITFTKKMINQLTEIQQQELNLTKISILAKSVADSEWSDLDEDELQQKRTDLKLKLIQQYLASEFIRSEKLQNNKSERHALFGSIDFSSLTPGKLRLEHREEKPSN